MVRIRRPGIGRVGLRLALPCAQLALGLLLASSCRVDNPAFVSTAETGATPGTNGVPNTMPDGPGPEAGPGDTQGEPTGEAGVTSSQGQGESIPEPGDNTSEDSSDAAIKAYCDAAAICFPIHDVMPRSSIADLGPSSLAINFTEPVSTVAAQGPTGPLNRAIQLVPNSAGVGSAPLDLNGSSEIAFDIWFTADDIDSVNWTLFELDNFLAVERIATGGIRCTLKGRIVPLGPAADPDLSSNALHHVACGIKDGRMFMWWDGRSIPYAFSPKPPFPSKVQIGLGQAPSESSREPFVGRVAGIRVWSDVETMRIRNNLPQQLNASGAD